MKSATAESSATVAEVSYCLYFTGGTSVKIDLPLLRKSQECLVGAYYNTDSEAVLMSTTGIYYWPNIDWTHTHIYNFYMHVI